jgi:hypothetical protein
VVLVRADVILAEHAVATARGGRGRLAAAESKRLGLEAPKTLLVGSGAMITPDPTMGGTRGLWSGRQPVAVHSADHPRTGRARIHAL